MGRPVGDGPRDPARPLGLRRTAEFSPDGKTLYTTSHDGTAIAWRIAGDRGLGRPFEFTPGRAARDFRHPGAYVLDGRLIAVGLKGRGIGFRDGETLVRARAPAEDRR